MNTDAVCFLLFIGALVSNGLVLKGSYQRRNAAQLAEYRRQELTFPSASKSLLLGYPAEMLLAEVQIHDTTTQQSSTYVMSVETATDRMFFFNNPGFNENLATSLSQQFTGEYKNYEVTGERYSAFVSYKSLDEGPALVNQTFAIVDPILSFDDTPIFQCDGLLGLGWSIEPDGNKGNDQNVVPPIRNILASLAAPKEFYVLYVESPTQLPANSSFEIAFGQDLPQCGPHIDYTSLFYKRTSDDGFLYIYLDGVRYGVQQLVPAGQTATVDSGSPIIGLPFQAWRQLLSRMPLDFNYPLEIYTTDCSDANTLEDLVFQIGGSELAVPASHYVADIGIGDGTCALLFDQIGDSMPINWILGLPFLQSRCVFFDLNANQFGFSATTNE
ncbi:Asp-1 [Aphelenchoides fujianensis]|nr:Asp-1 [Aphelenchoides fujianensis]